jgi:hypothetical protein
MCYCAVFFSCNWHTLVMMSIGLERAPVKPLQIAIIFSFAFLDNCPPCDQYAVVPGNAAINSFTQWV